MNDQDLIAKQAAIIQALECEIKKLHEDLKDVRLRFDMKKQLYELQAESIRSQSDIINMQVDEILGLRKNLFSIENLFENYKINKKRPKFIMIINRKKKHGK